MKSIPFLVISMLVLLLSGCARQIPTEALKPVYGYGDLCSKQEQCCLVEKLKKYDVQVEQLGPQMIIIIPRSALSGRHYGVLPLKPEAVLDGVIKLLRCYQKMTVQIKAYVDSYKNAQQNNYYANQEAEAVSQYLWRNKINARVLYVDHSDVLKHPERRNSIIITTKKLP